jgi:outer membrane protein, multidrug efflux system
MTKRKTSAALLLFVGLTCGCAVGPNYKKPTVNTPTVYRGLTPEEAAKGDTKSFAEQKWWDVFQDEQLKELIKTALQQNYDLRRAGARILQAQAALGLTRSNQFPTISADASALNERTAQQKFIPAVETNTNRVGLDFNWELDFWGKFRRATEAARANLAATEWGRQEIARELVASVASSYFTLRALDLQLEITRRTLASRQDSLRLTRVLAEGGSTSLLDVRQAEQLVFTAGSEIPSLEQQIEQQENFISILLVC